MPGRFLSIYFEGWPYFPAGHRSGAGTLMTSVSRYTPAGGTTFSSAAPGHCLCLKFDRVSGWSRTQHIYTLYSLASYISGWARPCSRRRRAATPAAHRTGRSGAPGRRGRERANMEKWRARREKGGRKSYHSPIYAGGLFIAASHRDEINSFAPQTAYSVLSRPYASSSHI